MNRDDFMWLVGLLEGEASFGFYGSPIITLRMIDKDIVERAAMLMGNLRLHKICPKLAGRKTVWSICICGNAAMELMRQLLPHLGIRRADQVKMTLVRARQRRGFRLGSAAPNALLKEEWIPLIRHLNSSGISQLKLAEMCGVAPQTMSKAIRRITWKHVA